jgi:hypothetical protein
MSAARAYRNSIENGMNARPRAVLIVAARASGGIGGLDRPRQYRRAAIWLGDHTLLVEV